MNSPDAWVRFKRVAAEFAALLSRASETPPPDRLELLLQQLDRLELAYLDLPRGEVEERPDGWPNTWKLWFSKIQSGFPELTTHHSVHPTSVEWPEPKLRALPDELALVLANIDCALWLDDQGNHRLAMFGARADYEQQIGARVAHLRAYIYHQRFEPEGNE
jgi:hypothetical protein